MLRLKELTSLVWSFSYTAGWKVRCADYFPYSTYFEGSRSSAVHNLLNNQDSKIPVNGGASHPEISENTNSFISNGKLEAFKNLTVWRWCYLCASTDVKVQCVWMMDRADCTLKECFAAEDVQAMAILSSVALRSNFSAFIECEMHSFANVYNLSAFMILGLNIYLYLLLICSPLVEILRDVWLHGFAPKFEAL